ncbi:MAG: efflux RND transporter permease subunit, partial [Verrucomicrobiales bacterium]|nr:efflux RND transporter permease subunit [Verrucomicrobiales bacterium]
MIWTLVLTDTTFNMQAFLGVIMLVGIVVNNAIILIDY